MHICTYPVVKLREKAQSQFKYAKSVCTQLECTQCVHRWNAHEGDYGDRIGEQNLHTKAINDKVYFAEQVLDSR